MKKRIMFMIVCVAALAFAACNKETSIEPDEVPTATVEPTATPEPTVTPEPTATPKPTVTPKPTQDPNWYENMLEKSVRSTGNNARVKKVLEKARSGETVNVVTLGGSITEGGNASPMSAGYAYLFAEEFGKTYGVNGGENINYVNAGLSGTPSSLGVIRYQRDVVDALGADPDLLFIEFAVNDWAEATKSRAYESMVYDVLSQDNDAAVVMILTVTNKDWNVQSAHLPIAEHYDLPVVGMKEAVFNAINKKQMTKTKYFADEYHPNNYGHQVMKDCLMQLFATIDAEEAEEMSPIPDAPKFGREFSGTIMVDAATEGILVEAGSFTATDKEVQGFSMKGGLSFPNNWKKDTAAGNEAFKMTLNCKNLLLNYKTGGSKCGTADIFVDGQLKMTVNGADGWNNSNVVLLVDEKEAAEHTVEIRMAEGQEDKTFTIYAFGYTK